MKDDLRNRYTEEHLAQYTTTWRKELEKAGCVINEIVDSSPAAGPWMDVEFYCGHGAIDGCSFTVWSEDRVYFPVCYDGLEWVESVSRNPDGEATGHVGGG